MRKLLISNARLVQSKPRLQVFEKSSENGKLSAMIMICYSKDVWFDALLSLTEFGSLYELGVSCDVTPHMWGRRGDFGSHLMKMLGRAKTKLPQQ